MTTLDDYLTGQFHVDRQELISLEETISKACETLVSVFDAKKGWPYRIVRGNAPSYSDDISHSTTAMVALSLFKAAGSWNADRSAGVAQRGSYFGESLGLETAKSAAELLRRATLDDKGEARTASGTYGLNDPITSAFLAALLAGTTDLAGDWNPHKKFIQDRAKDLGELAPSDEFAKMFNFSTIKSEANDPVPNALIPLRVVQTVRDAGLSTPPDLTPFRRYFETTLHDQLSFSSIPDSRFDPAELAFCLEGLLLTQANVVDRPLLERTLEVLESAQKHSAFWRPTKPFLATARGMTLFPVSVEVANSILRSCELFDGSSLRNTVGSANVGLFRRYWQWLNARKVTFPKETSVGATVYVGWDSEHVNQIDVIHVWETSQVLEFLLAYHRLLKAHIARTTLTLSKFAFRAPPAKRSSWEEIEEQYEPAKMLGQQYQVYNRIGDDFVKGWSDKISPKSYSMLLYGPPGTGKTTVAEKLAEALDFPLITITVADFLVGGGGQVEARAKAIFEVLDSQSNSVVLFDEIDAFLLDRDTKRYSDQDTVFQFMTPGMLTKINDLRKAERLIFVIATNYENRIDPAIKRTGRIDRKYLLLPYDKGGRSRTIRSLAGEQSANSISDEIAESSLFLGYGDLRNAVPSKITEGNADHVAHSMRSTGRTTRIASFTNRLPGENGESGEEKGKWPLEEFICLLALALENHNPDHREDFVDKNACKNFIRAGGHLGLAHIPEMVERAAPSINPNVREVVARYLESISKE